MTRSSAVLTLLLFAGPVGAQEATPPVPAELGLAEALRIAREYHPAYAVQQATLSAADAEERGTEWWLRYLPTLRLGFNASVTRARVLTGTDEFGQPIRLDDPISFRRTDSNFGPIFGQVTLFDSGRQIRSARSTRAGVQATRAGVEEESRGLVQRLTSAYFAAVQAEHRIGLEERLLESTRLNLDAAQRLLRVGAQDPLDVVTAELAVAEAENRLESARGEARKARLALVDAMGLEEDTGFELADELPDLFDPSVLDADALVAAALSGNASLTRLQASAEQNRYALADVRANRWPSLSALFQARPGDTRGSGSDPLFYLNPLNHTYVVSLNVSVPLFDRFQASNQIAQASAQYAGALEQLRVEQHEVETTVRGALVDLDNAYRALGLRQRTAELARQRLELTQQKYRLGSLLFNDLQSSVDAAYQAEYDALAARFDFANALLALEEAAGVQVR